MRFSRIAAASAVAFACAATQAAPASAYVHEWSPFTSPSACSAFPTNTRCYDNQGLQYNPWGSLRAESLESNVAEICAKAVNTSGVLRTTTTGTNNADYCGSNTNNKLVNLQGTTDSRAYVYWNSGSGGGTQALRGRANTDG